MSCRNCLATADMATSLSISLVRDLLVYFGTSCHQHVSALDIIGKFASKSQVKSESNRFKLNPE